jgi:hypothetical protein
VNLVLASVELELIDTVRRPYFLVWWGHFPAAAEQDIYGLDIAISSAVVARENY